MDLVMVNLRERSESSDFLKLLIKRSNSFNSMFGRGRGYVEYVGLEKHLGLKAMETVNYATTRFSSSSFEQWDKIYSSYLALIVAFIENRQDVGDDCKETRYQVRGQDYAIDLCGVLGMMKPVITLMIKTQALTIPPWKITAWFRRVSFIISNIQGALEQLRDGIVTPPDKKFLPRLATHWEELTNEDIK